jgi:spermidine synthase
LRVVEALDAVIGWHERHLLPGAAQLTADPRCDLVLGDFFAIVAAESAFGVDGPEPVHAVLVDIDHSPGNVLHPSHAPFYLRSGLQRLARRLHPGGIFGLWSDDPPDPAFIAVVQDVFASCVAHVVTFPNFITEGES